MPDATHFALEAHCIPTLRCHVPFHVIHESGIRNARLAGDSPDQGAGVCPFGGGVLLGSDLPDSKKVDRTAPIASDFPGRELGRCDVLGCSEGVSLFLGGLGVSRPTGLGAGFASDVSSRADLFFCEGLGLFRRSAASAPAFRISSNVGSAEDFLLRVLGLAGSGGGDSEGVCSVCSGVGAACFGASGFVSRATITSCAFA